MNTPQLEPGSIRARDGEDDLLALAATANEAYADARRHIGAACNQALEGGRALLAAKKKISHGEWDNWLRDNFQGSARTARAWMQGARKAAQAGSGKTAALPISLRALLGPGEEDRDAAISNATRRRRTKAASDLEGVTAAALRLAEKDRGNLAWKVCKSLPAARLEVLANAINKQLLNVQPERGGESDQAADEVLAYWNEFASQHNLTKTSRLTSAQRKQVAARIKDTGGTGGVTAVIDKIAQSDFLRGGGDNGWKATLPWLVVEQNFLKVADEHYPTGDVYNDRIGL